jgi:hypothetical protein
MSTTEIAMRDEKSLLASRTVWANVVGLLAVAAQVAGVDIGAEEADRLVEAVLQIVAAASFLASTVFRVVATARIGT